MKPKPYFENTKANKITPPVRHPDIKLETRDDGPDGKQTTELMDLLNDGQLIVSGRRETMTRLKLPRAWPKGRD